MKNKYIDVMALSFAMIAFISCAKMKDGAAAAKIMSPRSSMQNSKMLAVKDVSAEYMSDAITYGDAKEAESSKSIERKLVRTGHLSLFVSNLTDAEDVATAKCSELGGYISSSNKYDSSLSIEMKIPSSKFDDAVESFSKLGKLNEKSVFANDVTDRYYDIAGRIATKKILYDRLQSYLKTAESMKDLVAVETQLNTVQSDLESMQGQFKLLSNQIDYSAISVSFMLPKDTSSRVYRWPSLKAKLKSFLFTAADFFLTLFVVIIGIVVFGIPVVCIAAVIFWLSFGKIGLVRKLFRRLNK